MMPRPYGDAILVQCLANDHVVHAIDHERDHPGLRPRRPRHAQPRNQVAQMRRVRQQVVLVGGVRFQPDPLDIVQRSAQADGIGDVAGARLEPRPGGHSPKPVEAAAVTSPLQALRASGPGTSGP